MNDVAGARASTRKRLTQKERWTIIQSMLESRPVVLISDLASQFNVSVETARRDIDAMAEAELLERTYGGATALNTASEPAINQRATQHPEARQRIAEAATALVRDGQVLMFDSCATCFPLAHHLVVERQDLKIITNSFPIANIMTRNPTFDITVAGGQYKSSEGANYGSETTEFLRRFVADHCFSSCSALSIEGPTEVNSDLAAVKRVMFTRARRTSLLVDHDKFRRPKLELVSPLDALDHIFTDAPVEQAFLDALATTNAELHVTNPPYQAGASRPA
ncbi:DeoR/GlpR family DNA-binding transcription regulator [Aquisalimonas asiatica]|uniref:Transcriptional regulator, DeoR family n=1 Tax=Aquisalimonas asiatica TaxID=406100 RepID=A0A1H8PZD9_9GAMM|nr:DeoR/GlpR family DNA-binding transcription regulator [Aquisalimonas asiatica]SEO47034.1 transcriptional regulator, DeoR family [Aquisalimonas asiatica]